MLKFPKIDFISENTMLLDLENMKMNEHFPPNYLEGDGQGSLRVSLISVFRADFQDVLFWLGLSSKGMVFPSRLSIS